MIRSEMRNKAQGNYRDRLGDVSTDFLMHVVIAALAISEWGWWMLLACVGIYGFGFAINLLTR